jgi:hypothetical protein
MSRFMLNNTPLAHLDEKKQFHIVDTRPPGLHTRHWLRKWAASLLVITSVSLSALFFAYRPCHHKHDTAAIFAAPPTVTINSTVFTGNSGSGYNEFLGIRYANPA